MASQKVHGQVLQPGSACLTCRQRKTKCDGVRPICGRCARLGKQCAFENETRKPRTERLLDKIALLESKIAAYDPQNAHLSYNGDGGMTSQASSSRNVADDHASMGHPPSEGYLVQESALSAMSSTHSSSSSSPSTGRPMELLPIYPQSSFAMLHGGGVDGGDLNIVHTSSVAYNAVISCEVLEHSLHQWNGQGDVPEFLCDYLVRLFLPHRSQFHFHADVRSFLTRIHLPANYPQALHPAFLNSVFLLACHVSLSTTRSSVIATYERIFLQRTRTQLEQSLAYADRLTHFLWGSAFLGSYYTRCGRFVEAYNTISAAVRFAVGCGIDAFSFPHNGATCQPFDMLQSDTNYEVAFMHLQSGSVPTSRDGKLLAPSNSPEELLRRNHLWGAIFLTDRTLVEASGMPSSVPRAALDIIHQHAFNMTLEELMTPTMHDSQRHPSLSGHVALDYAGSIRLRVNGTCLMEAIQSLAITMKGPDATNRLGSGSFWQTFNLLGARTQRDKTAFPPLNSAFSLEHAECVNTAAGIVTPYPNPTIFVCMLLNYAAEIQLHQLLNDVLSFHSQRTSHGTSNVNEMQRNAERRGVKAAHEMAGLLRVVISPSSGHDSPGLTTDGTHGSGDRGIGAISSIYADTSLAVYVHLACHVLMKDVERHHQLPVSNQDKADLWATFDNLGVLIGGLMDFSRSQPSFRADAHKLRNTMKDRSSKIFGV